MNEFLVSIPWPIHLVIWFVFWIGILAWLKRTIEIYREMREEERLLALADSMDERQGHKEHQERKKREKPFVNLNEYGFAHDHTDEDVERDWEPQPGTVWTRLGGARADMQYYEFTALLGISPPGSDAIMLHPRINVNRRNLSSSNTLTIARAKEGTLGMMPHEVLVATQGYCSGGFYLDPEFEEQV